MRLRKLSMIAVIQIPRVLFVLIYVVILCDLNAPFVYNEPTGTWICRQCVPLAPVLIVDTLEPLSSYALFSEAWHECRTFSSYFLPLLVAYMATHGRILSSFSRGNQDSDKSFYNVARHWEWFFEVCCIIITRYRAWCPTMFLNRGFA